MSTALTAATVVASAAAHWPPSTADTIMRRFSASSSPLPCMAASAGTQLDIPRGHPVHEILTAGRGLGVAPVLRRRIRLRSSRQADALVSVPKQALVAQNPCVVLLRDHNHML